MYCGRCFKRLWSFKKRWVARDYDSYTRVCKKCFKKARYFEVK